MTTIDVVRERLDIAPCTDVEFYQYQEVLEREIDSAMDILDHIEQQMLGHRSPPSLQLMRQYIKKLEELHSMSKKLHAISVEKGLDIDAICLHASTDLLDAARLYLLECEPLYISAIQEQFGSRHCGMDLPSNGVD